MTSNKGCRRRLDELTFIDANPARGKDVEKQQLARTHGIRNAFRKRYQGQQDASTDFHEIHQHANNRGSDKQGALGTARYQEVHDLPKWSSRLAMCNIDPFETLPVNASRLTALLHLQSSQYAGEPVFSLGSRNDCRTFYKVFDAGLQDAALANALCLTLKFAANDHALDRECIDYYAEAIQQISRKLSDHAQAASVNTLGAVLLLIGVEGRLCNRSTAQAHLHGVEQIMSLCNEREVLLSHSIQRAAFWQDLNTAMLAGTSRIFDHETFSELHWHRDPYSTFMFSVPCGFLAHSEKMGHELLVILGDICALQRQKCKTTEAADDMVALLQLDNRRASIESRLQHLLKREDNALRRYCAYAAYVCAYSPCGTRNTTAIPYRLSLMLIPELENSQACNEWNETSNLMQWIISVGACFAKTVDIKARYAKLWLRNVEQSQNAGDPRQQFNLSNFIWPTGFEPLHHGFLQSLNTMQTTSAVTSGSSMS